MASLSCRAPLLVGLMIGLVMGCAHSNKERATSPPAGSTVSAEDIERNPGQPLEIDKVLQTRFSGVEVSRAGDGSISVRIRGAASFYGNTEPLYVIDGSPFQPGPGGSLLGINPHDIQSIRVLKNPDETALYGIRGANGVIVIQTKTRRSR